MLAQVKWSEEYLALARAKVVGLTDVRRKYPADPIILTKGVFDILHYGHLSLFAMLGKLREENPARNVVAIATDEVVRSSKGLKRPIQSFEDRCLQVALHPYVDLVVPSASRDLSKLITSLSPSIFVKGQDTAVISPDIHQAETVELQESENSEMRHLAGVRVVVFCDRGAVSTSNIVGRILDREAHG